MLSLESISTEIVPETSELSAGFVIVTFGAIVSSSTRTITVIWSDDSLLLESTALASIWFAPELSAALSTVIPSQSPANGRFRLSMAAFLGSSRWAGGFLPPA